MKIVYYNCEIAEQAVGENQNSYVLAAGMSNAYAQRVAQMEQDSFDDAWTEAMVADSLAQSYNHLWLAEDDAGTPCGYLLANVLGDETELLRVAVNPERRKDGIGQLLMDAYLAFARIDAVRGLLEVRHGMVRQSICMRKMDIICLPAGRIIISIQTRMQISMR